MTDLFKRQKHTNQNRKYNFYVKTGNRITSEWKWMNLMRHARMQNKDDNKQMKDDKKLL